MLRKLLKLTSWLNKHYEHVVYTSFGVLVVWGKIQDYLQLLVEHWDPEFETFQIDGMSPGIKVEDIYFITSLSRWGEVVNLWSHGPGGELTIDDYIVVYFLPNTEKVGSQILTNSIQILGLKDILLALGRIASLASLHQASRPMMFYAVECMCSTIYD